MILEFLGWKTASITGASNRTVLFLGEVKVHDEEEASDDEMVGKDK
jgi:hypothetical protein